MSKQNERIEMPNEVHKWLMQHMNPRINNFPKCYESLDTMWLALAHRGLASISSMEMRKSGNLLLFCFEHGII